MKYVVFDFDGTISSNKKPIWSECWNQLPQVFREINFEQKMLDMFADKKITYPEWLDYSSALFVNGRFSKADAEDVAKRIKIVKGFSKTMRILKARGYHLCIVSGGIKEIIEMALGDDKDLFDDIAGSSMAFNSKGNLVYIKSTKYDYIGKANYIKKIMQEKNVSKDNILFVGDSDNDEFVYLTGCKTLCVNPHSAHYANKKIWHNTIKKMDNFEEILPYVCELEIKRNSNEMSL